MVCPDCQLPEKKWCEEYGLPSPDAVMCWVTGQSLKVGELNKSNPNHKNPSENPTNGTM